MGGGGWKAVPLCIGIGRDTDIHGPSSMCWRLAYPVSSNHQNNLMIQALFLLGDLTKATQFVNGRTGI